MPRLNYTVRSILPNATALVRSDGKISRLALGVSLDNPRFAGESLEGVLAWCAEHSQECLLFLGDALYERTYRQLHHDDLPRARQAARQLADKVLEEIQRYTCTQHDCRFVPINLSTIAAQPAFAKALEDIGALFCNDSAFRESIITTAKNYVARRRKHRQLTGDLEAAQSGSVAYLIDEIAFYHVLCDQGWLVETYPGHEMPVLADILRGRIPRAPEILKRRIFIELKALSREFQSNTS